MSWLVIGFIVFLTLAYVVISLLFPEWVGMTGKKALDIQREQQGDPENKNSPH
jgi:hypothetical protein